MSSHNVISGMAKFSDETEHERTLRRLAACTYTLIAVAEDLDDTDNLEERADLLIAVENLYDVAMHIVECGRDIAWQHTLTPSQIEKDNQEDY